MFDSDSWKWISTSECVNLLFELLNFSVGLYSRIELYELLSMGSLDSLGNFNSLEKESDDSGHLRLLHATGSSCWSADTDATGVDSAENKVKLRLTLLSRFICTYEVSPTTEFLLHVMCIISRTLSTLEPVTP